jgi:kynurenine formamidase
MNMNVVINGRSMWWNTTAFYDLSISISDAVHPSAFHLPDARFEPFRAGTFVGSIEEGGPVRCDVVTMAPHGNGTHTECMGHVAGKRYVLRDCLRDSIVFARLVTVPLTALPDGDHVITAEAMRAVITEHVPAVIIRTLPNDVVKRTAMWSGNNPAYMTVEAMQHLHELGVMHVLIDLPSVDREEDGGALAAHKMFWQWPHAPRPERTITEMIYADDHIPDGDYVLLFNAPSFDGDAAPSRPCIFPLVQSV